MSHVIRAIITDRCLGGRASYHAGLARLKAFVLIKARPLCVSRKRLENSAYRPVPAGSGRHTTFLRRSRKQYIPVEKTSCALTRASAALASSWLPACRVLRLSLRERARCLLARVRALMSKDIFSTDVSQTPPRVPWPKNRVHYPKPLGLRGTLC